MFYPISEKMLKNVDSILDRERYKWYLYMCQNNAWAKLSCQFLKAKCKDLVFNHNQTWALLVEIIATHSWIVNWCIVDFKNMKAETERRQDCSKGTILGFIFLLFSKNKSFNLDF